MQIRNTSSSAPPVSSGRKGMRHGPASKSATGARGTRLATLCLTALASLHLCSCAQTLHSQPSASPSWQVGFWYWGQGDAQPAPASALPELLYFHAGTISRLALPDQKESWQVYGSVPDSLPGAREYWLVIRCDQQTVPDLSAVPAITTHISKLRREAQQRHLNVTGVQFDIDSPTASLPRYAELLAAIHKSMSGNLQLSITALLDWFRDGTAIAAVVSQTDEFVPQFYDIAADPLSAAGSIGGRFNGAEWNSKLNRFGKRFRIGVSAFGRARFLPGSSGSQNGPRLFGDLTPLDLARNSAFTVKSTRNPAQELVLEYRATRPVEVAYNSFVVGDRIQFILATPEAIHVAVESAHQIQGNCAGVLFFRWPSVDEGLVLPPDEILTAAGLAPQRPRVSSVEAVPGDCAAVSCTDLYLVNADPLAPVIVHYDIRSSAELEYFLPAGKVPSRMSGPSEITAAMPPWSAVNRVLLGRAVSALPVTFQVESHQ
jgi:hypothetical protein